MPSENLNFSLLDNYLALLNQLSTNHKLELIAKLSKSMQEEKPVQSTRSFGELFGALKGEKSAEEQIEEIRAARKFTRNIEEL